MEIIIDSYIFGIARNETASGRIVNNDSRRDTPYHVTGWQLRDDVHDTLIRLLGDYQLRWGRAVPIPRKSDMDTESRFSGDNNWYVGPMTPEQALLVKLSI